MINDIIISLTPQKGHDSIFVTHFYLYRHYASPVFYHATYVAQHSISAANKLFHKPNTPQGNNLFGAIFAVVLW